MENLLTVTLAAVIATLNRHQYRYALVGGLAVSMLAEPRATVDIDVCALLATDEYPRLFARLREALPGLIVHPQPMCFARVDIHRAVHLVAPREIIIDFVAPHDTDFTAAAMQRSGMVELAGQSLAVLSPEDLIVLKSWAGRPQDDLDIAALRERYAAGLDADYLRCWGVSG